jgi:alkylation response protein AidB-like acyl-CoA dehydrogenase
VSRATTPEQKALVAEVRSFLAGIDRAPLPDDLDERFASLVAYERKLHAAGLAVVSWPERFGGRGMGPVEAAIVSEELGLGGAPETINFIALEVVAPALFRYASDDQLDRWLPPMAGADEVWCQLFSEPDAGSDLASLATKAVRDGDVWVVNGQKVWSTWGQYSHKALLLARTGTPESRHKGIAAFVVDVDTPGLEVRPLRTMTGEAEFAEVFLADVRISDADMVGGETDGWAVAMEMLAGERGPYAVRRASVVRATLEGVYSRARERGVDPLTRDEIARAAVDLHVLDRGRRVWHGQDRCTRGPTGSSTRGRRRSTAGRPRSSAISSVSVFSVFHANRAEGGKWPTPTPRTTTTSASTGSPTSASLS